MDVAEYLPMFLAEGREHLQELNLAVVRIEERPDDRETVDEIFRIAHSLKGMSAALGFAGMATLTHEMEDVFELLRRRRGGLPREAIDVLLECLDALSAAVDAIDEAGAEAIAPAPLIARLQRLVRERDGASPAAVTVPPDLAAVDGIRPRRRAATLRVDAERLDQLMRLMDELVLHRTRVEALADVGVPGLSEAVQDLARTSHALQTIVMQVRMIPVEAVFLRLPRLVRDVSTKLGKQVELELLGRDTELDRTVVDALGDPLVHLVRNALDHGLEDPHERVAAGKPATGTLSLWARHAGGNVVIEVRDDGRGVDPAMIARKAAEHGLIAADRVAAVDRARAVELLFHPGFSTVEVTSDISGRGVGLDAVRTSIRELGGEVMITSEPGRGTVAQIRLPLTLAIVAALLVEVDGRPFAIPVDRIERTVRLADHAVSTVDGRRMLVMPDAVLPIVDASERFGGPAAPDAEYAVVVRGAAGSLAVTVGTLSGRRELVTRPLPAEVAENSALSGAAVMSDGQIALIVDCDAVEKGPS